MTDAARATVWQAEWLPWGGAHAISGAETLEARFPGQWFQLEAGLHYNWHRHYDPSLGRYTQPDPLGFVDGPSVFAYARGGPQTLIDKDGRVTICLVPGFCPTVIRKTIEVCLAVGTKLSLDGLPNASSAPDYDRCIEACEGGDETRAVFCRSLKDAGQRRRCWEKVHEPEQTCKNWCEYEFKYD